MQFAAVGFPEVLHKPAALGKNLGPAAAVQMLYYKIMRATCELTPDSACGNMEILIFKAIDVGAGQSGCLDLNTYAQSTQVRGCHFEILILRGIWA